MVDDPNLGRLEAVVKELGPLVEDLCLVGGCATGVLITDPGSSPVRVTLDVDLVVEAVNLAASEAFSKRLRERGLAPEPGDPMPRWRKGGLVIDIMPLEESVLGFSNRWYASAYRTRQRVELPNGSGLYCIDGPHFLATKLEAFKGRGSGDFVLSHDLEDLVRVVDGRPSLIEEVAIADEQLRSHIAQGIQALLEDSYFMQAIPGYFESGYDRLGILSKRLQSLTES